MKSLRLLGRARGDRPIKLYGWIIRRAGLKVDREGRGDRELIYHSRRTWIIEEAIADGLAFRWESQ